MSRRRAVAGLPSAGVEIAYKTGIRMSVLRALVLLLLLPPAPPRSAELRDQGVDLFRLTSVTAAGTAGDDRLFLTQQGGLVHVFEKGALRSKPFLDLRNVVSTGGERGLLSLAFHPDYGRNGLFFVCYTDVDGAVAVARYRVSADPDRAD